MSLVSRIANLFRRSQLNREIDDELRAHIEMRTENNICAGMSPEAARRDAVLRFGNRSVMRERTTPTLSRSWPASDAIFITQCVSCGMRLDLQSRPF